MPFKFKKLSHIATLGIITVSINSCSTPSGPIYSDASQNIPQLRDGMSRLVIFRDTDQFGAGLYIAGVEIDDKSVGFLDGGSYFYYDHAAGDATVAAVTPLVPLAARLFLPPSYPGMPGRAGHYKVSMKLMAGNTYYLDIVYDKGQNQYNFTTPPGLLGFFEPIYDKNKEGVWQILALTDKDAKLKLTSLHDETVWPHSIPSTKPSS